MNNNNQRLGESITKLSEALAELIYAINEEREEQITRTTTLKVTLEDIDIESIKHVKEIIERIKLEDCR